ncbi:MAG: diguanylate cyclase, partial [Deltaproteobacteria bacterium]|nr:diguanylate cyclase [Deltaproteobacteria bacterium]
QLIKAILETSSDGILLLDTGGCILSSNAGFQKMVLQREEAIAGLNIHDFISKESQDIFELNEGKFDLRLKGKDDTPLNVFLRIQNLYKGNNLSGYIATIGDITERKKLEDRLRKLSIEDNLTGLYNRRYFDLKLEEEWRRANRSHLPLTLLMLDVDNFKLYNDTYGHIKGDMVLQKIANVLVTMTNRSSDKVFRYGGEEFVILLPETSREKLPQFLANIIRGVESLAIPHEKSLVSSVVTVSIGCKTIIPDKDHEMVELVDAADSALYQAKSEGRNRYIIA